MMATVPRPLIALLLGTVAFFAVWIVALKPSSSSSSSSGLGRYSSAIQAAHGAVSTANAASAAHGGTLPATAPAPTAATHPATPATTTPATRPTVPATATAHAAVATATVHHAAATSRPAVTTGHKAAVHGRVAHARVVAVQTASQRYAVVQRALHEHKVLALLFYNPMATDDRDVKAELKLVPTLHGAVVTEAIPLAELSRYTTITAQVEVNQSPTLVVIDHARGASTIVGFTTDYEIGNRVLDALAVPVS